MLAATATFCLYNHNLLLSVFSFQDTSGGPKWTRTTDLTIISRVL